MKDKDKEISRYDSRAAKLLDESEIIVANNTKSYLMDPYESYNNLLRNISPKSRILEIGAGMGENTELLLQLGHDVVATDISSKSVKVMRKRFEKYNNFTAYFADMEKLPFDNSSFDAVCSAGSLSYGNNIKTREEIYRVLDTPGFYIAVDSLNNNLVYRLNRYLHYLLGNRSKNTLKRMPNLTLIDDYKNRFGAIEVKYFGSLTWLLPLLKIFMKESQLKNFSNSFDEKLNIKASAFKFVMKVTKL
jgi:ubiquinone/menaquinone biosynthesis C-methylase UbiE